MSACSRTMPSSRSERASETMRSAALRRGSTVVICDSDVDVHADRLEPLLARVLAIDLARLLEGHAELVGLETRRNVRVALRVDVGIHAERDARRRALGPGARGDAIELARRLGVDGFQAERDRAIELLAGLADAGEDDLVGDQAGAQRDLDLAARVGVGRRAEPAQQAHQRQRRVGLERVVDGVRVARERLVETLVGLADGVRVVNVDRRADVGRRCGPAAPGRRPRARRPRATQS